MAELVSWGSGGRVSGPSGPSSQCEAPPGGRVTSPGPGLPFRASLLQGPHCRGRLPGDTTTSRSLQGWGVLQAAVQAPGGPPYAGVAPGVTGPETGHYTRPGETLRGEAGEGGSCRKFTLWQIFLALFLPGAFIYRHFYFLATLIPGTFTSWQISVLTLFFPGAFPSCHSNFHGTLPSWLRT